jgi:predicted TIM-barrel fold metal-dependent hydrolase
MIIDGHAHACGPFLMGENIVKILDELEVDKVVLVPGELGSKRTYALPGVAEFFPERDVVWVTNVLSKAVISITGKAADIPEGNRQVYTLARAYPERIVQFFWAMLQKSDAVQNTQNCFAEWQFKGIKLHQCWDAFSIDAEPFTQVADFAAKEELPIFIHVGNYREVVALIKYSVQHPQNRFIVGHLFGLEIYLQAKHKLENIYFDISTVPLISMYRLTKALQRFGAAKLIMGSDTPYGQNALRRNIERVKALPISKVEQEMILGKNLQTLLKL